MLLEPYPWLDGGDGIETEWSPSNIDTWFAQWQAVILDLASHYPDAYGIYIASNLAQLEHHHAKWITLINNVRAAFPNMKIFMRTNWWFTARDEPSSFAIYNAKLANPVFDHIDVLAIAWYFELTDTPSPSLDELKDIYLRGVTIDYGIHARDQILADQLAALSAAHNNVPIFAGELIVSRHSKGARHPWANTIATIFPGDPRDRQIQRRYMQAFMETIGSQPWCLGYSIYGVGYAWPNDNEYTLDPNARRYLKSQADRA